jgi:hypothetical protein
MNIIRRLGRMAILGLAASAAAGCGQPETITWQEELALHDGKSIVVTRSAQLGVRRREPGASSVGDANYTLRFTAPDGREIRWENPGDLDLLILDFVGDTPYIAASPAMVSHYEAYGCPEPAYVFLKYVAGEWRRIKFEEFPTGFCDTNFLVSSRPSHRERDGRLLSSDLIKESNINLGTSYKTLDPNRHSPDCNRPSAYNNLK